MLGHLVRDAQRDIGLPARQVEQRAALGHFDLDAGVRAREIGEHARQQVRHRDERGGHAHAAGEPQVAAEQAALDVVHARRDLARFLREQLAGFGRHVAAALALEQPRVQARLERIEPAQRGRVVDVQRARRAGQRAGVGDRECHAQIVPVECVHCDGSLAVSLQKRKVGLHFALLSVRPCIP